MAAATQFYGTGRRKTSVARVWLRPGGGRILVNRRPFEDYFPRETLRMIIAQPLQLTNTFGTLDATINVGGGVMGFFTTHMGVRADLRYFRAYGLDIADLEASGITFNRFDFWRASLGVAFKF